MGKRVRICHVAEPTIAADIVVDQMIDGLKEARVSPEDTFPVLGEALIRLLTAFAEITGNDPVELVHDFGKGIATADIKFNRQ